MQRTMFLSQVSSGWSGTLLAFVLGCGGLHVDHRFGHAEDWPRWRGPNLDAISSEHDLLDHWPEDGPRLAWNATGLGEGYASVVISQGQVYTIGKQDEDVYCFALDEVTGQPIWQRKIGTTSRIPMSTPTVDEDRVYVLDPDGDLVCLRADDGEFMWHRNYIQDFDGQMMSGRGYGESPLVDGRRLICTPGGSDAVMVALDKKTGDLIWNTELPDVGPAGADGAGFSSTVISHGAGLRQFVQLAGRGLIGVAADDGRFLWGYNNLAVETANIPTPLVKDDLVFAANGYGAGSVLLRLTASSEGSVQAEEVYRLRGTEFQNHHGGIVLVEDHVYGGHGSNNGLPTCVDLWSGDILWKRRGPGVGSAAIVYADGHFYFRYQNGVMALIAASPQGYQLKGTFSIPGAGGDSWAHPVVANGSLYLREKDAVWVYDIRSEGASTPLDLAQESGATTAVLRQLDVPAEWLSTWISVHPTKQSNLFRYAVGENTVAPEKTRILTLSRKHVQDNGRLPEALLQQLASLRHPFLLRMEGLTIKDSCLQDLGQLSQMIGLDLELCQQITDRGLTHLTRSTSLAYLSLAGTAVTENGLGQLAKVNSLRALDLEICDDIADKACTQLANLSQLRALVLKKTGFEEDCITDVGLKHLSKLSQLELLNLYGNRLSDTGADHLKDMRQLRELDLSLNPLTDTGIGQVASMPQLKRLELVYSTGFSGPMVTDKGLGSLASLHHLMTLNLTGARITDRSVETLSRFATLHRLTLVNSQITESGVKRLRIRLPDCNVKY